MSQQDHIIIYAARVLVNDGFIESGYRIREEAVLILTQRALDDVYGQLQKATPRVSEDSLFVLDIRVTVIAPADPD